MICTTDLRLHTDSRGFVWVGRSGVRAECSGLTPENFIGTDMFRGAQHIRVLGTPDNARLIVQMHEARVKGVAFKCRPPKIQLGSPTVCLCEDRLGDPAFVLQQLWQPTAVAMSPGCWHELSEKDYPTYFMLAAIQLNGAAAGETVSRVACYHPAWPALSFTQTFDLYSACHLICIICDPRWYNHPERPHRATRLWSYLGLAPGNSVFGGTSDAGLRYAGHAKVVLRAWSGCEDWRELASRMPDIEHPRNFLWRIYVRTGSDVTAALKACKTFIQFVRLVWLQGLVQHRREVFVPSMFFKREEEAAAFKQHQIVAMKAV